MSFRWRATYQTHQARFTFSIKYLRTFPATRLAFKSSLRTFANTLLPNLFYCPTSTTDLLGNLTVWQTFSVLPFIR